MSQAGRFNGSNNGGTVVETLTGNSGGPVPPDGLGNIDVVGDGITIDVAGNPGTNTLTISTAGSVATQYDANIGSAIPAAGILQVLGGANITTNGLANTIVIDVTGTTDHAVQIGNATASLTSLAVGVDGQVLIGATGADPAFAALTSTGGTIVFTPGANTLNLETDGSIATQYDTDAGSAVPALGILQILGGTGITTSGAGNTVTIAGSGTSTLPVTAVNTSPYVVLATDQYLSVDCSVIPITIQLPNAPATGRTFTIKDSTGSANTNNITVTTVGGVVLLDGATTYVMNTQYSAINVIFNGTAYEIY